MAILRGPNKYDGTVGAQATHTALGGSAFSPAGPSSGAVYIETNEGSAVHYTAPKSLITPLDSLHTASYRCRFKVLNEYGAPTSAVAFSAFQSAGDTNEGTVRFTPDKKLELRNAVAGTSVTSSYVHDDQQWSQLIHEVFPAEETPGTYIQRARVYTNAGALLYNLQHTISNAALTKHREGPDASIGDLEIDIDNVTVADEQLDEIIDVSEIKAPVLRVGNPTPNGFTVVLKTQLATQTRLQIKELSGVSLFTTPPVNVDSAGYSKINVTGLNAFTKYRIIPELKSADGWVAERNTEGMGHTAPKVGAPSTFRMALWGCQRDTDNRAAWEDLLDWNPHYGWDGGDRGYPNSNSTNVETHRANWEHIESAVWGMRRSAATVPFFYIPSDHDSAGGNSGWKHPGLTANKSAYRQVFPHPPLWDLNSEDALCFTKILGRFCFIQVDCRVLAASDFANHNNNNAQILGSQQEAKLFSELTAARTNKDIIHTFLISDPPIIGPEGGSTKEDWWPYFPAALERLRVELAKFPPDEFTALVFDNHLLLADDGTNNPLGDWSCVGSAGIKEDTGNWRGGWTPQHGFGLVFGNHVPCQIYTRMTCEDTGTSKTITFEGRKGDKHEQVYVMTLGSGSTAVEDHSDQYWDVDGTSLSRYAWNISTWGPAREGVVPLRGDDTLIPYADGTSFNKRVPDSRLITLDMWTLGTEASAGGYPVVTSRELCKRNYRALRDLFWNPEVQMELTKRWRGPDGLLLEATALAQYTSGLEPELDEDFDFATFSVTLRLADPWFYGTRVEYPLVEGTNFIPNPGDWTTARVNIDFTGPLTNAELRNKSMDPDVWFKITNLPGGSTLGVDSLIWRVARQDATGPAYGAIGNITRGGSPWLFQLARGSNEVELTIGSGAGTGVLSFRPVYH